GGQFGEHLVDGLRGLPLQPCRLGLWPLLVLARASALARRLSAIGRRIVLLVAGLLRRRLLARLDLGGVAGDHADDAPAERALDSAACILSGRSPCANSAKARENVASEGACERRSQPRIRR